MKKNLKSISTGFISTAMVAGLTLTATTTEIFAQIKPKNGRGKVETKAEVEKARVEVEANRGKVKLVEVAQTLNIPTAELSKFFKEQVAKAPASREAMRTWNELFRKVTVEKANTTRADFENAEVLAETLGSYIRLRRSGLADNFHIREVDLLEQQKTWTITQRTNFSRVLRRASEIAEGRKVITMDEAFDRALGEMGYLAAYKKGCSR